MKQRGKVYMTGVRIGSALGGILIVLLVALACSPFIGIAMGWIVKLFRFGYSFTS